MISNLKQAEIGDHIVFTDSDYVYKVIQVTDDAIRVRDVDDLRPDAGHILVSLTSLNVRYLLKQPPKYTRGQHVWVLGSAGEALGQGRVLTVQYFQSSYWYSISNFNRLPAERLVPICNRKQT